EGGRGPCAASFLSLARLARHRRPVSSISVVTHVCVASKICNAACRDPTPRPSPVGAALRRRGARGRMRRERSPMRTLLVTASLGLLVAGGACKGKLLGPVEVKDSVNVTVDEGGFKPDRIPAKRGRPLTLIFNRTTDKTCATEV